MYNEHRIEKIICNNVVNNYSIVLMKHKNIFFINFFHASTLSATKQINLSRMEIYIILFQIEINHYFRVVSLLH